MITPNKIYQYFQGNLRLLGSHFNTLSPHLKEQVIYRMTICEGDCVKYGKCKYCLCDLPGKFYVTESCNSGQRFPDLMSEEEWQKFKEENDIKL